MGSMLINHVPHKSYLPFPKTTFSQIELQVDNFQPFKYQLQMIKIITLSYYGH